jgi:hypothetical protein
MVSALLEKRANRCRQSGILEFGHFRGGTNVKPEIDVWIAAQRLNRLARAAVADAMAPLMLW